MTQGNMVEVSYTILGSYELIPKALCVVAKQGKSADDIVYPSNSEDCIGASICSDMDSSGRYTCIIDGVIYKFTSIGSPANNEASDWWCYLAKANKDAVDAGTVVGEIEGKTVIRQEDGSITFLPGEKVSVSVNNLNARDQYALQVLHGFLEHINDPASLSPNEISFYCDKAYEWAAYLMTTAATARATVLKEGGTSSEKKDIDVEDLSSNMEILLNNLVVELEKSDIPETIDSNDVTAKLITFKNLDKVVEALNTQANASVDTSTAVNNLASATEIVGTNIEGLETSLTAINALLNNISVFINAIGNSLETINTSLQNINVNVTYTE